MDSMNLCMHYQFILELINACEVIVIRINEVRCETLVLHRRNALVFLYSDGSHLIIPTKKFLKVGKNRIGKMRVLQIGIRDIVHSKLGIAR